MKSHVHKLKAGELSRRIHVFTFIILLSHKTFPFEPRNMECNAMHVSLLSLYCTCFSLVVSKGHKDLRSQNPKPFLDFAGVAVGKNVKCKTHGLTPEVVKHAKSSRQREKQQGSTL